MRSLAITICVFLSSLVTVAAVSKTTDNVRFASDIESGLNMRDQVARIVITSNDLNSPNLRHLQPTTSNSVGIPFHGLIEVKFGNLETFIDPFALASMIEQSLNSGRLSLAEVMEHLNRYD